MTKLSKQLIFIAKSIVSENLWKKFDSEAEEQGWKREKSDGSFEYRYQDADPNTQKEYQPPAKKIVDNELYLDSHSQGLKMYTATPLGGSTGAIKVLDRYDSPFVLKSYSNGGGLTQIKNEVLANKLYEEAGIFAPDSMVTEIGGKAYLAAPFVAPRKFLNKEELIDVMKVNPTLKNGFVTDCWLANWDVIGMEYDNIISNKIDQIYRIDNGGALLFRAQGGLKGDSFGDEVNEIRTLRDSSVNPTSAKMFGNLTGKEIVSQIVKLSKTFSDKKISDTVGKVFNTETEIAQKLTDRLIARKNWLINYAKELGKDYFEKVKIERPVKYNIPPSQEKGKLSAYEQQAIKGYTDTDYHAINDFLRGGGQIGEDTKEQGDTERWIRNIISGMKKLPPFRNVAYRGCDLDDRMVILLSDLKPNDILYMKAFTSASYDSDEKFGGEVQFTIHSKTGRDISRLSEHQKEGEVLFAPDTRFKVISATQNWEGFMIEVEEILPEETPNQKPVDTSKKEMTPEIMRKFLLNNPDLKPSQRERIMRLSPEDLKKVMLAILGKAKGGKSKGKPKEEVSDKFTEWFL